ncbi:unnamed protein product [Pleuronectes platessa]|uniref:Uncharacterized protein n=1 Tax=Pleuronectes platessa TaxID=8262 RepID=A0A9N7ZDU7_PLEPL|nr:unnamed protein product [Pleuronectes platessa]
MDDGPEQVYPSRPVPARSPGAAGPVGVSARLPVEVLSAVRGTKRPDSSRHTEPFIQVEAEAACGKIKHCGQQREKYSLPIGRERSEDPTGPFKKPTAGTHRKCLVPLSPPSPHLRSLHRGTDSGVTSLRSLDSPARCHRGTEKNLWGGSPTRTGGSPTAENLRTTENNHRTTTEESSDHQRRPTGARDDQQSDLSAFTSTFLVARSFTSRDPGSVVAAQQRLLSGLQRSDTPVRVLSG